MKNLFGNLLQAKFKRKFVKKKFKKLKFKKQSFTIVIALIILMLCFIVVANLYVAEQQTLNDTVMCQFILISLKASAYLLYADLERRFKNEAKKRKSRKNSTAAASVWIALEVLTLCVIVVVILVILKHQIPSAPFPHYESIPDMARLTIRT